MATAIPIELDAVIFGGGIAGLWILDALARRGTSAALLEANALGSGQTQAAQGIIHGGLKYTLDGLLSQSAETIREMPDFWRDCLAGRRAPDLREAIILAPHCYLWRTSGLRSRFGLIGAQVGLNVRPVKLPRADWPPVLSQCPGDVYRLDEPVLDPLSVITALANRHRDRILLAPPTGISFQCRDGLVRSVSVRCAPNGMHSPPVAATEIEFHPNTVVLAAGGGNEQLRALAGLKPGAMQRRPLHMVMARGKLPELNGHCTDAARTRATITSAADRQGRTVWQIGGQVAEDGVRMEAPELMRHARHELSEILPGLDLEDVEWASYRVDRAEGTMPEGKRPADAQVLVEGNVLTAWPTKMALAPRLSDRVIEEIDRIVSANGRVHGSPRFDESRSRTWPRPPVAPPPWEEEQAWTADP